MSSDELLARRTFLRTAMIGLWAGGVSAVAGCSAGPVETPLTPSATARGVSPDQGQTLASLGLRYGPTNFALPAGVSPTRVIDQDNVVTLIFPAADGQQVHQFLATNLVGWGWEISRSSADSLIFTQPGWEGATTISQQAAGLTLRVVPPS